MRYSVRYQSINQFKGHLRVTGGGGRIGCRLTHTERAGVAGVGARTRLATRTRTGISQADLSFEVLVRVGRLWEANQEVELGSISDQVEDENGGGSSKSNSDDNGKCLGKL